MELRWVITVCVFVCVCIALCSVTLALYIPPSLSPPLSLCFSPFLPIASIFPLSHFTSIFPLAPHFMSSFTSPLFSSPFPTSFRIPSSSLQLIFLPGHFLSNSCTSSSPAIPSSHFLPLLFNVISLSLSIPFCVSPSFSFTSFSPHCEFFLPVISLPSLSPSMSSFPPFHTFPSFPFNFPSFLLFHISSSRLYHCFYFPSLPFYSMHHYHFTLLMSIAHHISPHSFLSVSSLSSFLYIFLGYWPNS